MAESIHAYIKANGVDIQGESTQTSLGRENSIEIVEFRDKVRTARELGSRAAVGRRVHEPISIIKRIDKSTPLLVKALCRNEKIDGEFKFFRPNPAGDGTTEQFFTIKIENGRVDGIERHSPNALDPASSTDPPLETVTFVYAKITWIFTPTGAEYVDEWSTSD